MTGRGLTYQILSLTILLAIGSSGCGSGSSTPGNPETAIAPSGNPLVAQYQVAVFGPATIWVEFGEDTSYGRRTSEVAATGRYNNNSTVLVAGMKANTTYHMRAHVDWYLGSWVDKDQTFTTGTLPNQVGQPLIVPSITVTRPTPSLTPSAGVELLDIIPQNKTHLLDTFVTDLEGNIIWYYDVGAGNYAFPIRPMTNGDFLLGLMTELREIDLAGNTVREISAEQVNAGLQQKGYAFSVTVFHHDAIVLPNGDWVAIAQVDKDFTDLPGYPGTIDVEGDSIIDVDPSGNVAWAWLAFDHLDVNRHLFGLPDWTHSNALVYTPNDGNLLLSMRNQSWILKIDYENGLGTGDILWRLGNQGDFALSGGDPKDWFYGQHFPSVLATSGLKTTLAVFDDGDQRFLDESGDLCGLPGNEPCYSRATIFQIDENAKTASLDWQFSPGLYTFWGGSINQLPNGNVEFDLSEPFPQDPTSSQVMEVSQTPNPEVVWQMNIEGGNAYRAYRIPSLYPGIAW
jgi:arylsulfate sulfotransferase